MQNKRNQARGLAKISHLFLSGPEPPREKITIRAAAKILGVSKGTVITYLNNGLLTRIKEGGGVNIPLDEVEALGDSMKELNVTTSTDIPRLDGRRDTATAGKDSRKRILAHSGSPENEHQYRCENGAALEAKNEELEALAFGFTALKRDLETQASELERTRVRLRELEKEQQKLLMDLKGTADADKQHVVEKTQTRLPMMEETLKHLRPPWWEK